MLDTKSTIWAVGLCLGLSGGALADESTYYVIVFGSQRPVVKAPRYSHTFATFVRATPEGSLEAFTISWLPQTREVRPLRTRPEPGRNFTLEESLQIAREHRMTVTYMGPYQIHPDLWHRALQQKYRLESGQVLYKAYDRGSLDGHMSNCIHAVTFLTRNPGQNRPDVFVAPANWGESGSYWAALTLRPWYLEPCRTHDWLLPRLGLNQNEMTRTYLDRNPSPNPATRLIQAALHPHLLPNRVDCRP